MVNFNLVAICFYLFINVISCKYGKNLYSIYLDKPLSTSCTPGQYVIVDCNVCKCGLDGYIDEVHCTQNNCNNDDSKPHSLPKVIRRTEVPGSCQPNTWYSMGPCQFCFCSSKNKLVCNSEEPRDSIILGAFSLKVCGKGMGDEIQNLQKDKTNSKDRFVVMTQQESESKNEGLRTSNAEIEGPEEPSNTINTEHQRSQYSSKSSEESGDKDERHKPDSNERYLKRKIDNNGKNDNNNDNDDENPQPTEEKNNNDSNEDTTEKDRHKNDDDYSEYSKKNSTNIRNINKKHKNRENFNEELILKTDPEELTRHAKNKTIDVAALPALLDKFLKMAVRKSLMSLSNTNASCEPGATWKIKCNSCYCLKNGKTMCTQLVCKDK